VPAKSELA